MRWSNWFETGLLVLCHKVSVHVHQNVPDHDLSNSRFQRCPVISGMNIWRCRIHSSVFYVLKFILVHLYIYILYIYCMQYTYTYTYDYICIYFFLIHTVFDQQCTRQQAHRKRFTRFTVCNSERIPPILPTELYQPWLSCGHPTAFSWRTCDVSKDLTLLRWLTRDLLKLFFF